MLSESKDALLRKAGRSNALLAFLLLSPIDLEWKPELALGAVADSAVQSYTQVNIGTSPWQEQLFSSDFSKIQKKSWWNNFINRFYNSDFVTDLGYNAKMIQIFAAILIAHDASYVNFREVYKECAIKSLLK